MNNPKFEMSISLNVLNHLGIKLYSNVPAVLSEVVANSWDADASEVDIDIDTEVGKITITDNGHGMTLDDMNNKYLNVGYERRTDDKEQDTVLTAKYNRPIMGRKGIGKLSLFSIADTVEVQSAKEGKGNGFVMSAQKIEEQIGEQGDNTYNPDSLPDNEITINKNSWNTDYPHESKETGIPNTQCSEKAIGATVQYHWNQRFHSLYQWGFSCNHRSWLLQ